MSEKGLTTQPETRIAQWGQRDEIREIARRIQTMAPGARRLTEPQALALAQGAVAHGLDPFNGEIWYIPDSGLMAGIKGLRKAARRQITGNFWAEFEQLTDPDERRLLMVPDGALAFRCVIRDTETIMAYSEMWKSLAEKKVPLEMIPQVIGKRPYTEGVGYLKAGERTKMDPVQVAMKRAEADALKRRFDLPFAVPIEADANYIDADFVEATELAPPESPDKNDAQETAEAEPTTPAQGWIDLLTAADERWLIEKNIIPPGQKRQHGAALLDLLFKPGEDFKNEIGLRTLKAYRGARDTGLKPFEAAANAKAAMKDQA